MPGTHKHQSEVARLLAQISEEYEAAQQGLSGLAQGSSQHHFITRRMERMGELHSELRDFIGDEAIVLVAALLDGAAEGEHPTHQEQKT
jgi:hypothetical protein